MTARDNEQTKWAVGVVVLVITILAGLYAQRAVAAVELAYRHEETMQRIERKVDWLIKDRGKDPDQIAYATP